MNENLRKQLVVIVTQAKDEEEACVGTLQDKNETFCSSSLNAGNLLGSCWRCSYKEAQTVMTDGLHSSRHSTGSNTTLVLLLRCMGLFAPHEKQPPKMSGMVRSVRMNVLKRYGPPLSKAINCIR